MLLLPNMLYYGASSWMWSHTAFYAKNILRWRTLDGHSGRKVVDAEACVKRYMYLQCSS